MSKKLYIGTLSNDTTETALKEHFSEMGEVISTTVTHKISFQKNAGYGYVVMKNDADAKRAVRELNNSQLDKSHIRVMEAHPIDEGRSFYSHYRKKRRS